MIGRLGRRLVEGTVGLFALLGFLYVPLGRHTGFEHACAVFSTPQAVAALEDVTAASRRLRERAVELFTGHELPRTPRTDESDDASKAPSRPAPIPPKLK